MTSAPVVLLLPGMTLNETIFPSLPYCTVPVSFNSLVLGEDGTSDELRRRGIGVYVDLLDRRLETSPSWSEARCRILVAHSFGGMLGLGWWLAHHGAGLAKVDGIVLVSTTAGPMFDVVSLRLGRLGSRELRVRIGGLMGAWNSALLTRTMKRFMSNGALEADDYDFRQLRNPSDWRLDFAGWRNTDWRAMRSYRQALAGFDVRGLLAEIDVPVIVLHGDRDTLLPLNAARDLSTAIRKAELRVVPGAGHALPLTHPQSIVRAIDDIAVVISQKSTDSP